MFNKNDDTTDVLTKPKPYVFIYKQDMLCLLYPFENLLGEKYVFLKGRGKDYAYINYRPKVCIITACGHTTIQRTALLL